MSDPICSVCGAPELFAKARCESCYRYRRRWGKDRPEEEVIARNRYRLEAEQFRSILAAARTEPQPREHQTGTGCMDLVFTGTGTWVWCELDTPHFGKRHTNETFGEWAWDGSNLIRFPGACQSQEVG